MAMTDHVTQGQKIGPVEMSQVVHLRKKVKVATVTEVVGVTGVEDVTVAPVVTRHKPSRRNQESLGNHSNPAKNHLLTPVAETAQKVAVVVATEAVA